MSITGYQCVRKIENIISQLSVHMCILCQAIVRTVFDIDITFMHTVLASK